MERHLCILLITAQTDTRTILGSERWQIGASIETLLLSTALTSRPEHGV